MPNGNLVENPVETITPSDGSMPPVPDEISKIARADLVKQAVSFDQEQAQRAKEFQAQYERTLGKKPSRPKDPITWAWMRPHMESCRNGVALPGRLLPRLMWDEGYLSHPGYVPIERRMAVQ